MSFTSAVCQCNQIVATWSMILPWQQHWHFGRLTIQITDNIDWYQFWHVCNRLCRWGSCISLVFQWLIHNFNHTKPIKPHFQGYTICMQALPQRQQRLYTTLHDFHWRTEQLLQSKYNKPFIEIGKKWQSDRKDKDGPETHTLHFKLWTCFTRMHQTQYNSYT